jgi:hypothetical protein
MRKRVKKREKKGRKEKKEILEGKMNGRLKNSKNLGNLRSQSIEPIE